MSGRDEAGLFPELAEQAAPARALGGRPRLRRPERGQVELQMLSLDDLLPPDHRVRLVWSFAEGLELAPLYAAIKAVEGHAGHPPADPRMLMALWLNATIDGVGSARQVARLCEEHLAYRWLCGGVGVNAKTLADFRIGHGALLEELLIDGVAALLKSGVARLERVAQDGVRVRASAGAASFRRASTLKRCRRQAAAQVARLKTELEADPGAAERRHQAARRRAAREREQRVKQALEAAEALGKTRAERAKRKDEGKKDGGEHGGGETKEPKEARASTTDPEARVMKMADGGWRPAYNVQFATDVASGVIAAVSVDAVGSDMGKLAPMSDKLARDYGIRPAEHLADGGFAKLDDLIALAKAGVIAYVPVPKPRQAARDRHLPLPEDPPELAAWRLRMGEEGARTIYRERAAAAELPNAQARNRGLVQFPVRGAEKVKIIALWYALAHNMTCCWRLQPA